MRNNPSPKVDPKNSQPQSATSLGRSEGRAASWRFVCLSLLSTSLALGTLSACGADRTKSNTQKPASAAKAGAAVPAAKPSVAAPAAKPSAADPAAKLKQAELVAKAVGADPNAWTLLAKQSFVGIEVLKGTGEHYARFEKVQGHASYADQGFAGLSVSVKTESFEADVPAFAEHVRSEQFLDVKKYPTASFVSTSLRKDPGPVKGRHMLEGDLTLRGKTQRVIMQADLVTKGDVMELQGRVPLDFKAFGMSQAGIANELIDGVELSLRLKFQRPAGKGK